MKWKEKQKSPLETDAPPVNEPEEMGPEMEADAEVEIEVIEETAQNPEENADYEALYNQLQDRYKRTMAEFDNFRKRTTKEKAARYDDGLRAAADKLLPIKDNFERAMSASENKEDNFYQGIALIARQFENMLADIGIKPIADEIGTNFDHNIHHAVAHIEDDSYDQNVIVEVLQKGYMHRDKVLRPSMVKVAN